MEEFDGVRCRGEAVESFVKSLVAGAGASEESAAAVARALTDASMRAVDTHGVRLTPHYLRGLKAGRIKPNPTVRIERLSPAVVHVDADDGLGHLASYRGIEAGIEVARENGIAAVAIGRSTHHGATGVYTLTAARQGFAALGMTNADAIVAPHDGVKAFFGTNPITFAVPAESGNPLLLDMATSSIPLNRVLLRRDTGTDLPPEVAIDGKGEMTVDPFAAAALVPLGGANYGYKGAGLAVMVDMLCSAFTGMLHGARLPSFAGDDVTWPARLGHFFIIFDTGAFQPRQAFANRVAEFLADLRGQPARPGESVKAPGDPEWAALAERTANGLPIDAATWKTLGEFAQSYGCAVPDVIATTSAH
ncbi:Ldh family oxidoreductase [Telmatospirillum siberiense]|nr:Ldh family oxidoreductase [Telmatospirillum siberiense]